MKKFISLSELSRAINIALPRAQRLARLGVLRPDGTVGKTYIFDPLRMPELRASVTLAVAQEESPLFVKDEK
jgi:hypothetical protein